jgi:sensor histidine kinase regulating citrate/malate metabolism
LKFSSKNTHRCDEEGKEISTSNRARRCISKINVSDTGSGIQKNQFKSIIFEPGFTTKKKQLGIGLSLSKLLRSTTMGQSSTEFEIGKEQQYG